MEIVERPALHLDGATLTADLSVLPLEVPALWRRVMEHASADDEVFAELSDEPGGDEHVITVGRLVDQVGVDTVEIPAGRWLHHRHEGPVEDVGATYDAMFDHAEQAGLALTRRKLDVGYRPDGAETAHDLYLQLAE